MSDPAGDVDRKHRYERVVNVVDLQTTDKQHPGMRPRVLGQLLASYGKYTSDGIQSSLRAAVGSDLVLWHDETGQRRLTCRSESDIQRAVRYAGERELTEAVARLNCALAEERDE